eukprot:92656_1
MSTEGVLEVIDQLINVFEKDISQILFERNKDAERFKIFTDINIESIGCKSVRDGCLCSDRIINALKYYFTLDVINKDKNIFIKFTNEIYTLFLNDFIHILDNHNNEID